MLMTAIRSLSRERSNVLDLIQIVLLAHVRFSKNSEHPFRQAALSAVWRKAGTRSVIGMSTFRRR